MAKIAIGGFHHESNSFVPGAASWDEFVAADGWPGLTRGEALFDVMLGMNLPISGFIAEAARRGHALVPLAWANAQPSGPVTSDAFERMAALLVADLAAQHAVDALFLDLHGAMVAAHFADGEGELLRRLRAVLGAAIPIAVALDLHANVTQAMLDAADFLVAYRTYPHVDYAETGARAARLLDEWLRGGKRVGKALRKLPFLIPLTAQCTLVEPGAGLYRDLAAIEQESGAVLSFAQGFPPADIAACGPSVVAHAGTQEAAERAADSLAARILAAEPHFAADPILAPEDAVRRAQAIAQTANRPVILADTQDNPGAGASSDTTGLLRALQAAGARRAFVAILHDPEAARAAHQAGLGASLDLALGGRSGAVGDSPYRGRFAVRALGDGRFAGSGPMYGGSDMALGPMALLEQDGIGVIVGSRRQQAATQAIFRHLGIEPAEQKILALKSSVHFRADFQPIAEAVLVVAAPGLVTADPADLPYRNLRKGVRLRPGGPAFSG
jgi:microcystin degradation protein MlrC